MCIFARENSNRYLTSLGKIKNLVPVNKNCRIKRSIILSLKKYMSFTVHHSFFLYICDSLSFFISFFKIEIFLHFKKNQKKKKDNFTVEREILQFPSTCFVIWTIEEKFTKNKLKN